MSSLPVNDIKGISVNVSGGSISNLQIQQGSANSSQAIAPSQNFDYEAVSNFLNQIGKYPMLSDELGENAAEFSQLIKEAKVAVRHKEAPSKIKTILMAMKDLMVGVTGSLIASGIGAQIPTLLLQLGL